MPKRKKRAQGRRNGILVLGALVLVAVIAGCGLLRSSHRPSYHPAHHPVPVASIPPVAVATETPVVEAAATATPEATASVEPSTSPVAVGTGPKLALIIDDCGQWLDTERAFIALPIPLTLSVLPDVRYNTLIAREANSAGKGVMLHMPMETVSGVYPGPGEVTTEMTDAQIVAMVQHDLSQVPLAQGVNNHEGSKGSADTRVMTEVASTIAKANPNLFFIDSMTAANSVAASVAAANGLATAKRDVFLDNKNEIDYVEGQLREAEALAKKNGSAIAIGHPRSATIAAVTALYPEFERDGITFVLVSSLTTK